MDSSNNSSNSTSMGDLMSEQLGKEKAVEEKDTSDFCSKLFMMTFQKQLMVEDPHLEKEHEEFISHELLKIVKHKPEWEQLSTVVNNLCSAIIEEVKNTIENDEHDKLGLKRFLKKTTESNRIFNREQQINNDESSIEESENKSRENGEEKENLASNGKNEDRKENGESVAKKKRVEENQS